MTTINAEISRQLNHAEMVYRPGERALAARVFELLGMRVLDHGGEWFFCLVDPAGTDVANNACYASQVTAEQWALEQALSAVIAATEEGDGHREQGDLHLGHAARAYLGRVRAEPQRSFHFGIRYARKEDFDATLDRIRQAEQDPDLAGRVGITGIYDPHEPGALAPNMIQAFVRTDVVSAGLLAFGQHIELQWPLPKAKKVYDE